MKKIAIISAYAYVEHHVNYGSLLQYYALQTYFELNGFQPYWIRYILPEEHCFKYKVLDLIKTIVSSYDRKRKKVLKKQFVFINENINLSEKEYCGFIDIKNDPPKADLYITGSDQVWGGCIEANYLCFANDSAPKMAYAASFGRSKLSDEQRKLIPEWIKKIDYVSLREAEGVKICNDLKIPSIMVVDPTLLLNKCDYPVLVPKVKPEFFCYFLNEFILDKEVEDKIKQSNSVFCSGVNKNARRFSKFERELSPAEWIGMIKSAECILTNSFHGMIFSIIFEKPFVVFLQKGTTEVQNSRIYSFLSYVGLEDRIFISADQFSNILNKQIDWLLVSEKINSLRNTSIQFIHDALEKL